MTGMFVRLYDGNRIKASAIAFYGAITTLVLVLVMIFLHPFSPVSANGESRYKYYTSVTVSDGDTLWDLSGDFISSEYSSRSEYILEVRRLNHMTSEDILYSGNSIVMPYYSSIAYLE